MPGGMFGTSKNKTIKTLTINTHVLLAKHNFVIEVELHVIVIIHVL